MKSPERNMKQCERQFFRYCIRRLNYEKFSLEKERYGIYSMKVNQIIFDLITPMSKLIQEFSEKKNIPEKQLVYYKDKWIKIGFLEDVSDVETSIRIYLIPNYYKKLIPDRVISILWNTCDIKNFIRSKMQ